jgi:hypothetical protein
LQFPVSTFFGVQGPLFQPNWHCNNQRSLPGHLPIREKANHGGVASVSDWEGEMSAKVGFRLASIVAVGLMAPGCASIIKGSSQQVTVSTGNVQGAECTLNNGKDSYTVTTPGSVSVKKRSRDISAICRKEGYQDGTATVAAGFEGLAIVSAVFGLIPIAVDAATGAINDYPSNVNVQMYPAAATPQPVSDMSGAEPQS